MQPAATAERSPGDWLEFISTNNAPMPAVGRLVETSVGVTGLVVEYRLSPNKPVKVIVHCPKMKGEVDIDPSKITKSIVIGGGRPVAVASPCP